MKHLVVPFLTIFAFSLAISCSQKSPQTSETPKQTIAPAANNTVATPHSYGGWYCPDNLNGYPAVNLEYWDTVPFITGRMATNEDIKSQKALIYVDPEKYPNASPINVPLPQLATYYNRSAKREDLVIIFQAFQVNNDSIVGFRFLNGGNGSAHLRDVSFLNTEQIAQIPKGKFVTLTVNIAAPQDIIFDILTQPNFAPDFQPVLDPQNKFPENWRHNTNVNYATYEHNLPSNRYADQLFGNFYIQNDYFQSYYSEKFLLLENELTHTTDLQIVVGPFTSQFESQKNRLMQWAQTVKRISESI